MDDYKLHFFYGKNINDIVIFYKNIKLLSKKNIYQFIDNFYSTVCFSENLTNSQKSNFLTNLIVMVFYVRNFRENGKGLRDQSRFMFMRLRKYFPNTMDALLSQFIEHGCWKDYNVMIEKSCDTDLIDKIYTLYIVNLKNDKNIYLHNLTNEDKHPNTISLASKWVPKEGKSLDRRFKCSSELSKKMFPELFKKDRKKALKMFRQYYSPLQDILKTQIHF